jgi:hypothetical protein
VDVVAVVVADDAVELTTETVLVTVDDVVGGFS